MDRCELRPEPLDSQADDYAGGGGAVAQSAPPWDRQSAADFLVNRFAVLRRRVQRRLQSHGADIADTDDVLAICARKLDTLVSEGRVLQTGEGRMWALICRLLDRSTIDLIRSRSSHRRAQRRLFDLGIERASLVGSGPSRLIDTNVIEAARTLLESLDLEPIDKELVSLRCRGVPWPIAAELIGQTPEATRKRWSLVCERLREAATEQGEG